MKQVPSEPPLDPAAIEGIAQVLGDTAEGLTGRQIERLLAEAGIDDPGQITKADRLDLALTDRQARDGAANAILRFVELAMRPVRYRDEPSRFQQYQEGLNMTLSFAGMQVGDDGKLSRTSRSATLSDAENRANRLHIEMRRRSFHPDVIAFCKAELLADDYFHATFEATKSVAHKLHDRTGLSLDGQRLIDRALSPDVGLPMLAWNRLESETDWSEHRGIVHLLRGLFAYFRNIPAHVPRVHRPIGEREAIELLTLVSFLHRKLDDAVPTSSGT